MCVCGVPRDFEHEFCVAAIVTSDETFAALSATGCRHSALDDLLNFFSPCSRFYSGVIFTTNSITKAHSAVSLTAAFPTMRFFTILNDAVGKQYI